MTRALPMCILLLCLLAGSAVARPGNATKLGNKDWRSIHTMVVLGAKLYVGDALHWWGVDASGVAKPFRPKWGDSSGGTARMTALNGKIYCVHNRILFEVDHSGKVKQLSPDWPAVLGMTALDDRLYIISSNELYEADPATGEYKKLSEDWYSVEGMAVLNGTLYVLRRDKLVEVDRSGKAKELPGDWNSGRTLVAADGQLYAFTSHDTPQGPLLNECALESFDPRSGRRERIALPKGWERGACATAVAAGNGRLFMISGGSKAELFAIDIK